MLKFTKPLQEFLASKADFRILYSTSPSSPLASADTSRIVILDSSFNPPHLAHSTLAKDALEFEYNGTTTPKSKSSLLLLLSVKNADKITIQPAPLDYRLEMMYLMAQYLESNLDIHVSIGITNHARFVDKSVAIINYLKSYLADDYGSIKLTFAVGFDTLERILDPKYYLPDKLSDSLKEFMRTTDLFCLTRSENVETYNMQLDYLQRLRHGKIPQIPEALARNVHVQSVSDSRDNIGAISSTSVRNAFASGESANVPVIPEIKAFIEKHSLYK
ncbi:putative nicotinamide-nucleotide adenylyltransferase [Clavispora lusitaniae]|uniref:Nicotinamide-nucleotide adenylyltransferase n=1 Tax=Clavispora lusitaniae TaxID=36911 RepID=A0AA91PVH5_CLALS|nr:putative nicotinamide-nucleotide adenylyltransferase [Clavispora lusitaniae]